MSERKDIPATPDATEGDAAADQLPGGCETCDGTGRVWVKRDPTWFHSVRSDCPDCHGTGDPQ